jgi:hypothetical protein
MTDATQMRWWALLAQVRQLRIERKRRLLSMARHQVEGALAETERRKQAIGQHSVRRGEILAAYAAGDRTAFLWRVALRRHDSGRLTLDGALSIALRAEGQAQAQVMAASRALQREMSGKDDALARLRRLTAARQNGDEPED